MAVLSPEKIMVEVILHPTPHQCLQTQNTLVTIGLIELTESYDNV